MRYLVVFLIIKVLLFAQEKNLSIDAQIAQIKKAKPSERVALMNAFKVRLSKMNQTQRVTAISSMRIKMQMRQNKDVTHNQYMNQHRVGGQTMKGAHRRLK